MNDFVAYGLAIRSEIPLLPDVLMLSSPDVVIRLGDLSQRSLGEENGGLQLLGSLPEIATFLVCEGKEIIVDPHPGVSDALLRSTVLASAMSVVLRQRGLLVLHGSCVSIEGRATAFLGHSGWGKSTLAAAFHSHGFALVTDDVLAVDIKDDYIGVIPSFPLVKLWPEAAARTGKMQTKSTPLRPELSKSIHEIEDNFSGDVLPLSQLYVLGKGEANEIVPMQGKAAFVELVRHSRTANTLIKPAFVKRHFEQCSTLTQHVPVSRLLRRYVMDDMPEVIEMVKRDIVVS